MGDIMSNDDNTQLYAKFAIIAFNITVLLCIIIYSMKRVGGITGFFVSDFIVTIVLASIVASGVFVVAKKLNL
jgi:hypothetical protein